jgi:hypothetical protein
VATDLLTPIREADRATIIGGAIRKRRGALVGVNTPRFRQLVDESRGYLFGKMNYTLNILS